MRRRVFFFALTAVVIMGLAWCAYKYVSFGSIFVARAEMDKDWEVVLVNSRHYVGRDYKPELTELSNGEKVDSRIYPHLQAMFDAARAHGFHLIVRSGYRSYGEQEALWNEGGAGMDGDENGVLSVQRPGLSEHQTGLAVDINRAGDTDEGALYSWLQNNAARFGFILRYPADKTEITGVIYEPWHYRYVGVDAARAMKADNLCLEEYVGEYE
ncbi:MAG: M15 family metallopeptidase [Anaerovoracaceae bacterium]|jgi:D-alanyl-D-alanine carboxypeptidase